MTVEGGGREPEAAAHARHGTESTRRVGSVVLARFGRVHGGFLLGVQGTFRSNDAGYYPDSGTDGRISSSVVHGHDQMHPEGTGLPCPITPLQCKIKWLTGVLKLADLFSYVVP